jgi:hypothetical protein
MLTGELRRTLNTAARGALTATKPKDLFKMVKHVHVKVRLPDEDGKEAAAANTARQRTLRLVKEAADRDATNREIAVVPTNSLRRQPTRSVS